MTPAMLRPCSAGRALGGVKDASAHAAGDDDFTVAFALGEETHDFNAVEFGHNEIDGDDVRAGAVKALKEIVGANDEVGCEAQTLQQSTGWSDPRLHRHRGRECFWLALRSSSPVRELDCRKHLADSCRQFAPRVRLAQKLHVLIQQSLVKNCVFRISRAIQDFQFWVDPACLNSQFAAVESAGYDDISEEQLNIRTLGEHIQCILAVAGFKHLVTESYQLGPGKLAYRLIVFD